MGFFGAEKRMREAVEEFAFFLQSVLNDVAYEWLKGKEGLKRLGG